MTIFDYLSSLFLGVKPKRLKIGYDDVSINALWNPEDEALVEKDFEKIKAHGLMSKTLDDELSFDKKLLRKYNDQTVKFYDGQPFEPIQVTKPKHDFVVNAGLIRLAQLATGKSSQYFTYFASGTGVSPETASQSILTSENYRVSMITDGYAEPAGTTMKFAGKFPIYVPTATISEGAVFDFGEINAGTMLFRTLYPLEARLPHTQYRTFYSLSQSIGQISVT